MLHLGFFGENKEAYSTIWKKEDKKLITDDGKHYKWTCFGDYRYSATMTKTSSDNRAGMNMTSLIDNLML